MNSPIYSVDAECRDCYKCVRHCPVKAIHVENDHASVAPEACILCGRCVGVCRHAAKRVRDDLPRVRSLLWQNSNVHASLAPSFVSEFPGIRPAQLASALKKLGFAGVHETAEGAERVSQVVAEILDHADSGLFLSTACPVAVDLVVRHQPELAGALTPVMSPMLAHARMLKARFGHDASVVFIGPCIGKKRDADRAPDLLHAALTFEELRRWFTCCGVDPATLPDDPDDAAPGPGARYPLEGGMNQTIRDFLKRRDMEDAFVTVSGLEHIASELKSLEHRKPGQPPLFLELLACEGGCVAGPRTSSRNAVAARLDVAAYARAIRPRRPASVAIDQAWHPEPVTEPPCTDEDLAATLKTLGKTQPEDELDCGGCGYDRCRALARAIRNGAAEPQMCVSHMRQLAQKKTNALARALPYGLVIADAHLRILECNERFGALFDEPLALAYAARPGLKDADLTRILPFPSLFRSVLDTGREIIRKSVQVEERIYSVTVFNIDPHTVVGALILDVTGTEKRRQQLIEKSRSVIANTTRTVQEIAYRLGQNSAQSELILNSAIELFAADAPDPCGREE